MDLPHSAILSLEILIGVSVKCLIFHPHPFLLNVLYILPLLCQMIQLSLKQSGCRGMQVRFKTTEIKLPCLFFNFIKQSTEVYHLQVPFIWLLGRKKNPLKIKKEMCWILPEYKFCFVTRLGKKLYKGQFEL